MSQEKLAEGLGLTFQQIQKYERGANRISASRLFEAARILEVPVGYFFSGRSAAGCGPNLPSDQAALHAFLAAPEGAELAAMFQKLSRKRQLGVYELVRTLADAD